jgi:hypothetical protein
MCVCNRTDGEYRRGSNLSPSTSRQGSGRHTAHIQRQATAFAQGICHNDIYAWMLAIARQPMPVLAMPDP